jgi:hypothetical protein
VTNGSVNEEITERITNRGKFYKLVRDITLEMGNAILKNCRRKK